MKEKDPRSVVTGEVRFSYMNVFEPKSIEGSEPKYSVSLIIPKSDKKTIAAINKAIDAAKQAGIGKFGGKIPANIKIPLRDGDIDREDDETYKDSYFINANCKLKPGLIDKHGVKIEDSTELYSGCYGLASVTFYAFNTSGNKGIACGLNNLMKTRDGESLGGRAKAEDDFAEFIEEDDEEWL
jgi:hypothetical protein